MTLAAACLAVPLLCMLYQLALAGKHSRICSTSRVLGTCAGTVTLGLYLVSQYQQQCWEMGNSTTAVAYPMDKRTDIGSGQGCRGTGRDEKYKRRDVRWTWPLIMMRSRPRQSALLRKERRRGERPRNCDARKCDALRGIERRLPGPKLCDAHVRER